MSTSVGVLETEDELNQARGPEHSVEVSESRVTYRKRKGNKSRDYFIDEECLRR